MTRSVIFRIKSNGTEYSKLYDLTAAANGTPNWGWLTYENDFLFVTMNESLTNSSGEIFKIRSDGTNYSKIFDFGSGTGSNPVGPLVSVGGFLFGMTRNGGGVIFKIRPDGTEFSRVMEFNGTNGIFPTGSLISDGTFLYGVTESGGENNKGLVFKIMTDGTGYADIYDFSIDVGAGATYYYTPRSVILDGGFLYGITNCDGESNCIGIIFKIEKDGGGYSKILDFSDAIQGLNPVGSLISDGTFLYGITYAGGKNNRGTIYKIKPDGTGYSKLFDFTGASNGTYPYGHLLSDGTFLFGATSSMGAQGQGIIFKIRLD